MEYYESKYTGEEIDNLLSQVENGGGGFDENGSYPNVKVGDLCGHGESVPAEFTFRATGGKSIKDGTAYIKELQGNAVVWNQKIDKVYVDRDRSLDTRKGESMISGHKYLLNRSVAKGECYVIVADDFYDYALFEGQYSKIFTNAYDCVSDGVYPTKPHIYCTGESGYVQLIDLTKAFPDDWENINTIEDFYRLLPPNIDINEYNEGEVIAFNGDAIKSVGDNAWDEQWESGHIDYNSGVDSPDSSKSRTKGYTRVIPNEQYYISFPAVTATSSLVVICYDANKAFIQHIGGGSANKTFTIPANCHYIRFTWEGTEYNNNIMLTLVHSGWKQDTNAGYQPYWEDTLQIDSRIREAFPEGMHKWDKVYNKDGKGYIVKGTGVVDLGTSDWYSVADGHFYAPQVLGNCGFGNLICAKYTTAAGQFSAMQDDKTIGNNQGEPYNEYLFVRDDAYTDAASFKAAMAGVILYYELAEPTIIEFDTPFKLDYKVADFGTEELISEQPSAPFKGRTIYQFNAVDQIRENAIKIQQLETLLATMQAQMANLTNN